LDKEVLLRGAEIRNGASETREECRGIRHAQRANRFRKEGKLLPSPFPGMDPYLEGIFGQLSTASLWRILVRQFVPKVAPRYVALANKRYVVDTPETLIS